MQYTFKIESHKELKRWKDNREGKEEELRMIHFSDERKRKKR